MTIIKLKDFVSWWRYGDLYQYFQHLTDEIDIDEKYLIKNENVNNINEFILVFDASNYFQLYIYPIEIYVFFLINKDEILTYMEQKNGTYEKLFIKEFENNKEILINKKQYFGIYEI